ncbi:MAG: LamB/YcsF family protein [Actinobacteria bacterium]|nr:LamB/YcsF family protein [Actinomycetota bacterium]
MVRTVDINSDCGESFGNWVMGDDEALIPLITTANVACGYHASDPLTMRSTVARCAAAGVAVGSHPGLPDLLGFGRRPMKITPDDGYAYVMYQTGALRAFLDAAGLPLHHVKPHGAFYSILREDEPLAEGVCAAIRDLMPEPLVYWPDPTDAALPRVARKQGIRVVVEAYVDLPYSPKGEVILQRSKEETDLDRVRSQITHWLTEGKVEAIDGTLVPIEAESVCVHGDGPNAAEVVEAVRAAIEACGCSVGPL